jgi:hypothetical protein
MTEDKTAADAPACEPTGGPDMAGSTVVNLAAGSDVGNYREAMTLAGVEADRRLGEHMLLAWYDRERDFESPQHASECHLDSAVPGYVDYALSHGATLKVDFDDGRFVFFYLPV